MGKGMSSYGLQEFELWSHWLKGRGNHLAKQGPPWVIKYHLFSIKQPQEASTARGYIQGWRIHTAEVNTLL